MYYTAGLLDLIQVRIYDKSFKLIATSNLGPDLNTLDLTNFIKIPAEKRKGADRFKLLTAYWQNNDHPLYSMLLPYGGLSLKGYIEVVTNPAHNL